MCYSSGVCRCRGGDGRFLGRLFTRFMDTIKTMTSDQSHRSSLLQGYLVIHWCGRLSGAEAAQNPPLSASASSSDPPQTGDEDIFTHVSLQYLKPWRPTLAQIVPVRDVGARFWDIDREDRPIEYIQFKVAANAQILSMWTLWRFLSTLRLNLSRKIEAWRLSERQTPTAVAGHAFACRIADQPPITLWAGPEKANHRGRHQEVHVLLEDDNLEIFQDNDATGPLSHAWQELAAAAEANNEDLLQEEDSFDIDVGMGDIQDDGIQYQEPQEVVVDSGAAPSGVPADMDAPLAELAPLRVLKNLGQWGCFRFSLKQPKARSHGGYEVTCPWHRLSPKTLCKKFVALEGGDEASMRKTLTQTRY